MIAAVKMITRAKMIIGEITTITTVGASTTAVMTTTSTEMITIETRTIAVTTTVKVDMSPIPIVVTTAAGLQTPGVVKGRSNNMTVFVSTTSA